MKQEVYTDYEKISNNNSEQDLDVKYRFMQEWIFNFNPYTGLWNAFPRNSYNDYWNNYELEGVLRSKDINTILSFLQKSNGNIDVINKTSIGNKNNV